MSTLLERLKAETRPLHEQTEQRLYAEPLRMGTLSADQYRHLLLTHAAYHQALEDAIDAHPVFFQDYQPDVRRKTPWLLADLRRLSLPMPASEPTVLADWSPVDLLGAAYVGEGSMLGGKTVWHYLQQSPALQPLLDHARFYRGYGPETGPNWRAFTEFISRQAAGQADAVVAAADRAFRLYHTLFDQQAVFVPNSGADARAERP